MPPADCDQKGTPSGQGRIPKRETAHRHQCANPRFSRSISGVSELRIGQAAELLGVSADTVRRWADDGRLPTRRTGGGHRVVDGAALAALAVEQAKTPEAGAIVGQS